MATNRTVKIHKKLSHERSEDRHSSNSNQSYYVNGNLTYKSSNSPISPSYVSASNNVFTGNHAYNDRLNLSNVRNHGKPEPFKSQLEGNLSSASNSSNRRQSIRSESNATRNFDDSYIQTSPGYESAYNEDNVYDTSPITEQQYDDCMSYTSYLYTGSHDNMDNPDMQRDISASPCNEDTHPIESSRPYENVPLIEEPVYDEVESYGISVQPAVEELLSTEVSYVKSLRFLTYSLRSKLEEIPNIDVRSLFSNLEEILLVHESFLQELKQTEHDPEHQLILIGNAFQEFSKDMESVYTVYCSTYTRSTSLLKHYQDIHVAELIKDAIKSLSSGSSSKYTDLSFYLVMPVQRITKYPLLLQNILSIDTNTKDTQEALEGALNTMKEVNVNINENERRKEVASKYLRLDQRTLKDKMSTLSTHTLTKKSQRLSLFLKQQAGMVPKREDKEFDNLSDKFHRLAAVVSQLEENVVSYVRNVEEYFVIQPETYPLEYLQGSVHPLNGYTIELCNSIYSTFKRKLQIMVLQPLTNLSECLRGPKNLIRKRLDKLLDYENLEERCSETGRMTWEEEDIVNNYKAIHSMLLSELPNCILLSYQLLHNIFLSFIAVQKDLAARACFAAEEHASQMQCGTVPEADFRRWVEDYIANSTSLLNEFTKKFDEELPVPVPREHIPAIERQIQQLLKRYSPEKLYQLMSAVKGTREMELTLRRGEVVAVIQCGDIKGNKNRWLVDTGGSRGYVPCSKLQPYQGTHSPTLSQSPTHTQSSPEAMKTAVTKKHSLPAPYPTFPQPQEISAAFQIVAGYSFTARSQYEVSIAEGEPVIVLEPHDKNGSPEWSLVEVRGQRGYVPSSYLVTTPVKRHSWVT